MAHYPSVEHILECVQKTFGISKSVSEQSFNRANKTYSLSKSDHVFHQASEQLQTQPASHQSFTYNLCNADVSLVNVQNHNPKNI